MAILHMAELPSSEWATAKGIAERYSIPAELLGKVMQSLARATLLVSMPGARGGYRLQQPLDRMNLGSVIEAVEGPILLTDCQENPDRCPQLHTCNIKEPIQQIHTQLVQYIYNISLNSFRTPSVMEKAQ